jgi:hypothetical protein
MVTPERGRGRTGIDVRPRLLSITKQAVAVKAQLHGRMPQVNDRHARKPFTSVSRAWLPIIDRNGNGPCQICACIHWLKSLSPSERKNKAVAPMKSATALKNTTTNEIKN